MTCKKCSRCQKEFSCLADQRGCWCEDLTLTTETLQALKQEYDNCLCLDCLVLFKADTATGDKQP